MTQSHYRRRRYEENAENPTVIACFDTDQTVDVPPHYGQQGPVTISHILRLKDMDHVSVWATGFNQSLRYLAGIPGMRELKEKVGSHARFVERDDRMRLLDDAFPDAEYKYVVDDVDLSSLEPEWTYWFPQDYARDVLGLEVDPEPSPRPLYRRDDRITASADPHDENRVRAAWAGLQRRVNEWTGADGA